jgi:hypothetical protein
VNIKELKEAAEVAAMERPNNLSAAILSLVASHDALVEALRSIAEYTGTGPATTPWQAIVKDLSDIARAALETPANPIEEVEDHEPSRSN